MHPNRNDDLKTTLKMAMCGSHWRAFASVIVSTAAGYAQATHAQESNPTLEEVVVSAQKSEETVQSVPISIQVVSGAALQDRAITTLMEVAQSMPSVKIQRGASQTNLYIRGVGPGNNASLEQSVVRFVDDVYDGRGKASEGSLVDIERVEVLKGPQTTYFGNNAIGGAFNITTRKPTDDADGYLRLSYNPEWGEYAVEGAQNIPLSDSFRMRIAAIGGQITEGWQDDVGAGETYPKEDSWAVRVSALWNVTDRLTATFRIETSDKDQEGALLGKLVNCPPVGPVTLSPGRFCVIGLADGQNFDLSDNVRSNTPGQMYSLKRDDYQATLNYDLGPATLTSVSAYSTYDFENRYDADGVAGDYVGIFFGEDYDQFSQELRLASSGANKIEYMLGVYFQQTDLDADYTINYPVFSATIAANPANAALAPYLPLGQRALFSEDVSTYSAFGVVTWNITDALSLSGGLRWTEIKKDFLQSGRFGTAQGPFETITPFPDAVAAAGAAVGRSLGLGNNTDYDLDATYDRVSPSARLQYEVTTDVMAYASYSDGFKSGGFQGNNFSGDASQVPFDSETVDSYEIGLKSEWFGNSLLVNLSAFLADYSDLQVASLVTGPTGGITQYITNAASARSQGVDVELRWAVTEHWNTGLNVTLLDSEYRDFPNAPPTPWQRASGIARQDLSGEATAQAPNYSGNWSIQYRHPITANFDLRINGDLFFSDDVPDPGNDPYLLTPAYEKYGASVTLINNQSNWEVSIIGKNLTDETVAAGCPSAPLTAGSYFCRKEDPRSVTIQAKVDW